jgi:hypothetical protein
MIAAFLSTGSVDAHAVPSGTSTATERIANQVNQFAPKVGSARPAVSHETTGLRTSGASLSAKLPTVSAGDVELRRHSGDTAPALSVRLPSTRNTTQPAGIAKDGTVVYQNQSPGVDVAVQAFDDSVRMALVIQNDAAATEFAFVLTVPTGSTLVTDDNGAVLAVTGDGALIGGLAPPWALDGQHQKVPTHYEVRGNSVVQVVEHKGAGVHYPVVADPYLGIDLISSARWVLHDEGWTLEVTPTWWARANAGGYLPGANGWDELYAKYHNLGLCCNLTGMRDQYICHQQIVAVRDPNKPTWNIDEWRPDVGYPETVNASCNPGGPRWFD